VIQRNGYFGHSEKIPLAMVADNRQPIRELGHRRNMAARCENSSSTGIRQFHVLTFNLAAGDYFDLVT